MKTNTNNTNKIKSDTDIKKLLSSFRNTRVFGVHFDCEFSEVVDSIRELHKELSNKDKNKHYHLLKEYYKVMNYCLTNHKDYTEEPAVEALDDFYNTVTSISAD